MICAQDLPVAFFGAAVFLLVIAIAIRDVERKLGEVSRALERRADDELQVTLERLRAFEEERASQAAIEKHLMESIVHASATSLSDGDVIGLGLSLGKRENPEE